MYPTDEQLAWMRLLMTENMEAAAAFEAAYADAAAEAASAGEAAMFPDIATVYAPTFDSEGEATGAFTTAGTTPIKIVRAGTPATIVEANAPVDRITFQAQAPVSSAALLLPENEVEIAGLAGMRFHIIDTDAGVTNAAVLNVWMFRLR